MADDPESTTDPESEPRPETISDTPTEFRKLSKTERHRHWSGVETGSESGRQVGRRPKDIFYEERKKMTDFLHKKDSWLADYYLEGRHHIWRLIIFIFCIWISDVHSDLTSKSSSDRES
jgi:hypothetical protein